MKQLNIDIETYSSVNLLKSGVYKYAESEDFEVLLFAYAVDGGEVCVVDLAKGECIPKEIIDALQDDTVLKWAFNAQFERVCLSRHFGVALLPSSWRCTMVWSAYMGLPLSLEGVGAVLGLEEQKLKIGKDLIRYFCGSCAPTKTNGGRTRNEYYHDEQKWKQFKAYNKKDVEVEMAIGQKLSKFPVPDFIWEEYLLDQIINDRGIAVDPLFVERAISIDARCRSAMMEELQQLTHIDNPNSVFQLSQWLQAQGIDVESLDKKSVKKLLKEEKNPTVERVLRLRQQLSKSSVKKYQAMQQVACRDNRCRGMFQFLGANRTGRFAGRLVQLQNLVRNNMSDLKEARELVKQGNMEALSILYDDTSKVLSELIRTAFIPKGRFYVVDFSAIEARVIAWLAKEKWREELFRDGGDIYCMSASQMFGLPVEKHGVNSELRQKGKIAELACIAEDEHVLTDYGLVPIQDVTTDMKVWDGLNWVKHEGVVYRGVKEVIEYDGLRATKDHLVWTEGQLHPIQFEESAKSGEHLLQTGNGRRAIRLGGNYQSRKKMESKEKSLLCFNSVYRLWQYTMAKSKCFNQWKKEKLAINRGKVRVYDIRNAGPYHRFTVSDKLVHNCGYGGSVGALTAMGALEMGLKEEELQPLVQAWRIANPNIVNLWWEVDRCVKQTVKERITTKTHGIIFSYQSGMLFITLPSGRKLSYIKPRIGENKFGGESVTYEGVGATKKWERIESYGPKFVENIVQAIARDILVFAMQNLKDYDIVAHVHDEVIIEGEGLSLEEICSIMRQVPPWAKGLILDADGYTCEFYKKE
ncbi:DNA polymerase [Streptococcus porci]|uniref:DNA polymerase n=1 Tax=Streptococcus porci TaxID=502567 RepID=UPI00040DD75D|nr:DNA polymerase [Streptococcus porci]QBX27916.1 DNA polymerase I [Streptococcus phage Javan422]